MSNIFEDIETGRQHTHDMKAGRYADHEQDIAWVQKNMRKLVQQHGVCWIAVKNKKVVASGPEFGEVSLAAARIVGDPVILWAEDDLSDLPLFR